MKWLSKEYQNPVNGKWYVKHKRFLIFPKKISGEWRWLEVAEWICQKDVCNWEEWKN